MTVVNVVVTCTKDKRYPVADECQLRNVPAGTLRERMKRKLQPQKIGGKQQNHVGNRTSKSVHVALRR